jgi:hypothetical protein
LVRIFLNGLAATISCVSVACVNRVGFIRLSLDPPKHQPRENASALNLVEALTSRH